MATERVAKFLGKAGLAPMPQSGMSSRSSQRPKKKAQERAKAAAAAAA